MGKVGSVGCVGFLVKGTGACVLVDEAGSCLSGGQDHLRWCVLGVCELNMIQAASLLMGAVVCLS